MPRLEVTIGSDRFHTETAWVNHTSRPTEIDTPTFTGRVLVLVKDFSGVTPDNSPPKRDSPYFEGRSRRFGILIEGKWKRQQGVEPYSGDEIQFGSDFDYLPDSFPMGPFNLGMKISHKIDPATYYEFHPPHGRPYIMSPYVACMNTFCAYPAPDALARAVVLSRSDAEEDSTHTFVPTEEKSGKKWVEREHWSFLGLRGDPKVDAFLASHSNLLPPAAATTTSTANTAPANVASSLGPPPVTRRPELGKKQSSLILGTAGRSHVQRSDSPPTDADGANTNASGDPSGFWGAPVYRSDATPAGSQPASGTSTPVSGAGEPPKKKKSGSRFSLSSLVHALDTSTTTPEVPSTSKDHLLTPDQLASAIEPGRGRAQSISAQYQPNPAVEKELGPWRFADEEVDATEDTNFIFLDPDHPRTVPQRRKHFCSENGKYRKEFTYDPDCIYTASFFTPFCDLNTFDLKMGPISINVAPYFTKMPIRYTLRSTRMVPRPGGTPGPMEEEVFATIAFRLVD
ncbi:hypothetical protein JCM10908_002611 [Rhodotorula pacifica]|uniref:DUF1769 domain-containing protein n=1 Tax=Rhodotorula pacifica TaxID=1495444 RepID=UPI00316F7734